MLSPRRGSSPLPTMIRVAALVLYPVKSLRGTPVASAVVDDLGLEGDRRFLVVGPAGRFITRRTVPRMALVSTSLSGELLRLATERAGSISNLIQESKSGILDVGDSATTHLC